MQKLITQTSLLTKTARLIKPMINLVGNRRSGSSLRVSEIERVRDMLSTSTTKKSFSTATEFKCTQNLKNKYNRIMLDGKSVTIRSCPPVKLTVYCNGKEGFTDADGDKWYFSQENGGNMKNYGNGWVIDREGVKAPVKTVVVPQNQLCGCDGKCSLENCCGKGGVFNVAMITDRIGTFKHGTFAMNITHDPVEAERLSRVLDATWFDRGTRSSDQKASSTESPKKYNITSQSRSSDNDEQASYRRHERRDKITKLIDVIILTICVGFPLVFYLVWREAFIPAGPL